MLDDFAAKNHEVFDPTADENKLEYTVLHQQYQQMLEAHIEGKLVDAAVDLGGFLAAERLDDPQRDQDGDVLPEADGAVSVV